MIFGLVLGSAPGLWSDRNFDMKFKCSWFLALFLGTVSAFAQMPGGNPAGGFNPAMMKLFGKNNAFTAKATVRMLDDTDKESMSMVVNSSFLDGKMRQDVDLNNMKSAMMSPQILGQMKQMGMDKVSVILRPDKKASYLIYPGLKSYVDMPMTREDAAALDQKPKIEKSDLGKESIEGHPTMKKKVVMTFADGKKQESTVWEATDLKDFPVRMQIAENGQNVIITYSDVQFTKPDVKQFEAPTGFERYDNPQKMMMEKMMGNAPNAKK